MTTTHYLAANAQNAASDQGATKRGTAIKKNVTFAAIAASGLAALTIGLAAPAVAKPSGNGQDTATGPTYPTTGQTAYGTYQNRHKSPLGALG